MPFPLRDARRWLFVLIVGAAWTSAAPAQEFRVYTRIMNESPQLAKGGAKPPVVSRSVTFFHAGKAYDYIEAAKEVTIFEPARQRFTILSTSRRMLTTLTLQEIEARVAEAKIRWGRSLLSARRSPQADAQFLKTVAVLEFQITPDFAEQFDAPAQRLALRSEPVSYEVRCADPPSPEIVQTYLRYTDWIAQLNYVVHPDGMLPGPRLELNNRLRSRKLLPLDVVLQTAVGSGIRLHAKHQWQWQLAEKDRQLIHEWESLQAGSDVQKLDFDAFQEVLESTAAERTPSRR